MVSPIGLIDLAVVIVSLAPFVITNAAILRVIRLLRIVSILKFSRFSAAMREIVGALKERSYDLLVCATLAFVLVLLLVHRLLLATKRLQLPKLDPFLGYALGALATMWFFDRLPSIWGA